MVYRYIADSNAPEIEMDTGTEIDKKKAALVLGGVAIVIVLAIVAVAFMMGGQDQASDPDKRSQVIEKEICGDGICSAGEDCAGCAKDCACKSTEECSKETKKCVKKAIVQQPKGPVCGDSICDASENCFDCGKDCACPSDEYCSPTEKACLKSVCGNNRCEPRESPDNCCLDCLCLGPGDECNTDTAKCEPIKLSISEGRAKELIESYYQSQGKTIVSMNVRGPWKWENMPIILVEVTLDGQEWPAKVGVYENEEVRELSSY